MKVKPVRAARPSRRDIRPSQEFLPAAGTSQGACRPWYRCSHSALCGPRRLRRCGPGWVAPCSRARRSARRAEPGRALVYLGQAEGPDTGAPIGCSAGSEPLRESEHGLGSQYAFGVRHTDGGRAMTRSRDYYEVLGVPRDADARPSRTRSASWPAATIPTSAPSRTRSSGSSEVAEAYGVLSDPARRASYDAQGSAWPGRGHRGRPVGRHRLRRYLRVRPRPHSAACSSGCSAGRGGPAARRGRRSWTWSSPWTRC